MLLATTILGLLAGPAQAQGWWDAAWTERATLTFDNSGQTSNLDDFPVLVVLDDATNFDHAAALPGGDDLRFVDGDGQTVLAYEIERWNDGGRSAIWVRVPRIDGGSTTDRIWMYFGNPSAGPGQNGPGTWRSSYVGVYHLDGDGLDATAGARHGSVAGAVDGPGRTGHALDFDGTNDQVELPDEGAFRFTTALTVSFQVQVDGWVHGDWDALVTKGDQTWRVHRCGSGTSTAFSTNFSSGDATNRNNCGPTALDDGAWHHVVAVYDAAAGTKSLYLDGALELQASESRTLATNSDPVWIGNNFDQTGRTLDGRIDEVRFEGIAHTADWVVADHLSQSDALITWCTPWLNDADGDGVCDADDACPLDDFADSDGDGVLDCADPCPSDALDDSDGDGVCDSADPCPSDALDDSDGDGVCDSADPCPSDALDDSDGDGACDSADPCPADNPDDTDGDGVCESADLCPGAPDDADLDLDGAPNDCDPCPYHAFEADSDGDGALECDDCDDTDPWRHPGALDTPGNGIDEDCDGADATLPIDTGTPGGTATGTPVGSPGDSGRTGPLDNSRGWPGADDPRRPGPEGCGCASSADAGPMWLLVLGLQASVLARRRRDGPGA